MSKFIDGFLKSDHFIYRQWDRSINDILIRQILKNINPDCCNTLYVISRTALKRINNKTNKELFIKIHKTTLITCFYCEFKDYQGFKKKQNYLIINKI